MLQIAVSIPIRILGGHYQIRPFDIIGRHPSYLNLDASLHASIMDHRGHPRCFRKVVELTKETSM